MKPAPKNAGGFNFIPDDGSLAARWVIIGEAGGAHENTRRRPFVGPTGRYLSDWWKRPEINLKRKDGYITNVYPYRPNDKNDISLVDEDELNHWKDQLHDRIAALDDPWLLIPTGNTALEALIGKRGIQKHRGSVYAYKDRRGRVIKVIPVLHPALLFRSSYFEKRCIRDWQRIAGDLAFRELRLPEREHFIRPTLDDVRWYVKDALEHARVLSIDIETPWGFEMQCTGFTKKGKPKWKRVKTTPRITMIGFAYDPRFSFTIDTTQAYWKSRSRLDEVWRLIDQLLTAPHIEKLYQNGHFDNFHLHRERGLHPVNWKWDTRWLHHCRDANDDHDLAYMASYRTREPFWKDEAKDPDEVSKYTSNMDAFRTYNGKDACVPLELREQLVDELDRAGRLDQYFAQYQRHFGPLLQMMVEGVRVDDAQRRRRYATLTAQCIALQDKLTAIAGEPLYGKVDLSLTKLKRFLYETLRLPKQYAKNKKGDRTVSTKEVVVRRLMVRYPEKIGPSGQMILDHRRAAKLKTFYDTKTQDADGRVRASYGFTPETGRLSSSKNPMGTGMNLQNTDRECRDVFLPDEGHVFLEFDCTQGESRIVDVLAYNVTGVAEMLERARCHPADRDLHTENAARIFSVKEAEVTKTQRYLGKRAKHAGNYGMKGMKLFEELLKDGFVFTPEECQRYIDAGLDDPIVAWQRKTRLEAMRSRKLIDTVWGGEIDFTFDRNCDDLFRRAYAWRPQRYLAKLVNQWGFAPLAKYIKARGLDARIRLHVHDSLVVSTPVEELYEIMEFVRATLERPVNYDGTELLIPLSWTIGARYGRGKEFKRFPSRDDAMDAAGVALKEAA